MMLPQARIRLGSRIHTTAAVVKQWNMHRVRPTIAVVPTGWAATTAFHPPMFGVPYSLHSSFHELQAFVRFFAPRVVVPTSDCSAEASRRLQAMAAPFLRASDAAKPVRMPESVSQGTAFRAKFRWACRQQQRRKGGAEGGAGAVGVGAVGAGAGAGAGANAASSASAAAVPPTLPTPPTKPGSALPFDSTGATEPLPRSSWDDACPPPSPGCAELQQALMAARKRTAAKLRRSGSTRSLQRTRKAKGLKFADSVPAPNQTPHLAQEVPPEVLDVPRPAASSDDNPDHPDTTTAAALVPSPAWAHPQPAAGAPFVASACRLLGVGSSNNKRRREGTK